MRKILPKDQLHDTIQSSVLSYHEAIIKEVAKSIEENRIVVVGMRWNGSVKKARKNLTKAGLAHHYLEYGSYTKAWRQRLALKMWTGFPTFPMIFVDQKLIGGNSDLEALLATKALVKQA